MEAPASLFDTSNPEQLLQQFAMCDKAWRRCWKYGTTVLVVCIRKLFFKWGPARAATLLAYTVEQCLEEYNRISFGLPRHLLRCATKRLLLRWLAIAVDLEDDLIVVERFRHQMAMDNSKGRTRISDHDAARMCTRISKLRLNPSKSVQGCWILNKFLVRRKRLKRRKSTHGRRLNHREQASCSATYDHLS